MIKNDIHLIKGALLVLAGDREAKKATVVIRSTKEGEAHVEVLGHGFVVHTPDHHLGKGRPKYYLISTEVHSWVLVRVFMAYSLRASMLFLNCCGSTRSS
jgi:hypothetical protein